MAIPMTAEMLAELNPDLTITVYGRPAPQGSKRHVGNGRMIESSAAVKPWRDDVARAADLAMAQRGRLAPDAGCAPLLDGPLHVEMTFTRQRPKSAPKRRHAWASTVPDLSKLIRSTEDALNGRVWTDDARVVILQAAKLLTGDTAALDRPGAVIRIWTLT